MVCRGWRGYKVGANYYMVAIDQECVYLHGVTTYITRRVNKGIYLVYNDIFFYGII